jgi:integral membrane protein
MTAQDTPSATPAALAATRAGRLFRAVAVAEACSWAGLLIGMLFKYVVVGNEIGVQVFGPIHGALFVAYVVVTIWAARTLRWPVPTLVLALVCSIPPLATLWFERRARRSGRLVPAAG